MSGLVVGLGNSPATLTVTDPNGGRGTATVAIGVGNTAPIIRFTAPANGGQFGWGDRVNYRVTGTDARTAGSTAPR